jgi:hypothetical protein
MNFEGALVNGPLRLDVLMIMTPCQLTIDNLDTTYLDNAVALTDFKPGRLCI